MDKKNELTHASYSEHGYLKTRPIGGTECKDNCLKYRNGKNQKFVYIDYYKDGTTSHPMRMPDEAEAEKRKAEGRVENPTHDWIPTYGPALRPCKFWFVAETRVFPSGNGLG